MTIDNLVDSRKGDLLGSREKQKAITIKSIGPAPKLTAALKELQMSTIRVQTFVYGMKNMIVRMERTQHDQSKPRGNFDMNRGPKEWRFPVPINPTNMINQEGNLR